MPEEEHEVVNLHIVGEHARCLKLRACKRGVRPEAYVPEWHGGAKVADKNAEVADGDAEVAEDGAKMADYDAKVADYDAKVADEGTASLV